MKKNLLNKLTFLTLLILSVPLISNAQASIPSQIPGLEEQISISVEPKFPKPDQNVTIKVEAYGTDLNKANITWSINGTTAKTGRGEKVFTINSGKLGEKKTIGITISPQNGPVIEKSILIKPEEVDLIWEGRTYTPPFYKGKSLFGPKEKLIVVAFPNFTSDGSVGVAPETLIYTWRRNSEVVPSYTGYGKFMLEAQGTILMKDENINVQIESDAGGRAQANLTVIPVLPSVRIYDNNPLYGIMFNNELGSNIYLGGEEKNISAYPYYFGFRSKTDANASYEWRINGQKIEVPESQNSLVFRNTTGEAGISDISVILKHKINFLEQARKNLRIQFEETTVNPGGGVSF